MSDRVEIIVQDIPQDLRDRIVAEAKDENVSITEVAVRVLAKHFKVAREPSGRPYRGESGSTQLLLAVPDALRAAVRVKAAQAGGTMRGVVIEVLSKHYGIASATNGRRARTTA